MAKFWITAPRYVDPTGKGQPPVYVAATPANPVAIELPDDFKPSESDRHIKSHEPEKPAVEQGVVTKEKHKVRKSHEPEKPAVEQGVVTKEKHKVRKSHEPEKPAGRAADQ